MPVDRGRLTSSLARRSSNSSTSSRSSSVSFAGGIHRESVANVDSFMRECRSAYLSVLSSTTEDITSLDELELALQFSGRSPSKKTLQQFWTENTESMKYNDFCDIVKKIKPICKDDLLKAFKKIDVNNDGFITHDEFFKVLTMKGERMTKSEARALLDNADDNGDGRLDYDEFCNMIISTAKECKKANEKKLNMDEEADVKSLQKKTINKNSPLKRGSSLMSSLSKSNKEDEKSRNITAVSEPKGYKKWACEKMKGCFYIMDDGKIVSHHYSLRIPTKTALWLVLQPTRESENDIDMAMFVTKKNNEVVAFTETQIKKSMCCEATLDAGTYNILIFTTGCKFTRHKSTPRSESKLVKGHGEDLTLTKDCREAFTEVFNQCDVDDDGLLDRKEFDIFQTRTSGEVCDDDSWEVLQEHFEMKDNRITLKGFLDLNLMEAKDSDGDPSDLWVTLEMMGYNRALEQEQAFPFEVIVYSKSGHCDLAPNLEVTDGGEELQQAVISTAFNHSTTESIKGMKDLFLHRYESDSRVTLLIENKSHARVMLRLDCSQSKNCISHRGSLNYCLQVNPKSLEIGHHLVPADEEKEWTVKSSEYIQ